MRSFQFDEDVCIHQGIVAIIRRILRELDALIRDWCGYAGQEPHKNAIKTIKHLKFWYSIRGHVDKPFDALGRLNNREVLS